MNYTRRDYPWLYIMTPINYITDMLNNIDLFSGIGGFSYAMHGKVRTIAYCDISKNCRDTLKSIMDKGLIDEAPLFDDIRELTHSSFNEIPHMITAGFPCQDISTANPGGLGLDGDRSSLFFDIVRLCEEIPTINHVFLENVSQIQQKGMLDRIYQSMENIGFSVKHIVVTAKTMGAPHTRRRCYILATKDISELEEFRLEWGNTWENSPDTMTRIHSLSEKNIFKHRCCLCGNSVVPACVSASYNHMVHGDTIQDYSNPVNISMEDGDISFKKPMWGTPYASFNLYKPYKLGSVRSSGVLFNQVWYSPDNKEKRNDGWTISPNFVEWLMGYPLDYTRNTLQ